MLHIALFLLRLLFQVGLDRSPTDSTYRSLLAKLPEGMKVVESAYDSVESIIKEVKEYVDEWLRYQVWRYQELLF